VRVFANLRKGRCWEDHSCSSVLVGRQVIGAWQCARLSGSVLELRRLPVTSAQSTWFLRTRRSCVWSMVELLALWQRGALYSTQTRGALRVGLWCVGSAAVCIIATLLYSYLQPFWEDRPALFEQRHYTLALLLYGNIVIRIAFFLALPIPSDADSAAWTNDPAFVAQIGVLVTCHYSSSEIARTLRAVVRHIPPKNIIVIDNANAPKPPDNTREVVASVNKRITYMYLGVGHKTNALAAGFAELPDHCKCAL
jgi:hypothetical protein